MRTFWIITLVLVTVLVMATAASASVRDSVASLVGDRTGAAEDSGDGGTFTVTATKTGGEPDASGTGTAWTVKNEAANAGVDDTYTFRTTQDPAGDGDCDADRNGEEVIPVSEAQVQPEEPVAAETATKKGKKGQEEVVAE